MKKWVKYFVGAMLLAIAAFALADTNDPSATFTLTPTYTDPMPGETITVTYKAKFTNSADKVLSNLEGEIKYDPTIYEYVSSANGTTIGGYVDPVVDEANGRVSFASLYATGGYTLKEGEEFVVGTVTLKVKDSVASGTNADIAIENPACVIDDESVTPIATGATIAVTIHKGSVAYTLSPESGSTFTSTPKFKVDGTEYASGEKYEYSFTDRSVTSVQKTVTFTDADGFFTPKSVTVTIEKDQDKVPTMTYLTKGKITVNITPTEAITAGAKWKLDGEENWRDSGDTVTGLDERSYTIKYKDATDYITPADSSVTIANETGKNVATVNTDYREKGALKVTLTPSTAKWKLDAETTERASGDSVKVNAGTHTVKFVAVDGYTTPADATVEVPEKGKEVSYAYKLQGSIKYTLTPTTAQWSIDDGATWLNSGDTKDKLDAGSYTVKFKDATGYFTPANETVAVAVGETKTATKTYTELGSVMVSIKNIGDKTPYWTLNGTKYNSGDTAANLPAGTYTISFEAIKGYHTPSNKTVEVKATNAPKGNTFSYADIDYGNAFGYMTVNFTPSGVPAQWSIDGTKWYDGATKVEINTGTYTVQFKDVDGYKKTDTSQNRENVEVKIAEETTLTADYIAKGIIEDEGVVPQTTAPTVTEPKTKPASVTSMSGGILTAAEAKEATDNILIGGTDKITGLPENSKKLNLLTDCKLIVDHTSSGNENLEFSVTLADGITLKDGQKLVALIPTHADKYAHYSFDATYDAATKTVTFTVNNFANFFSDAPVTFAAVDVEGGGSSSGGSGGGCNAGFGALALIFAMPFIFKKRK